MSELKGRGVGDVLIAVVDGLKGFPEAITATFQACIMQTCIVHVIRYSLQFASWQERKALAAALRPIYTAAGVEAAETALEAFEQGPWGKKYPGDHGKLAAALGRGDSVFRLLAAGVQDHLHHQCDRIPA